MFEIATVGLDLAKNVFQAHGADVSGRAVLRKKLRRNQDLAFFQSDAALRCSHGSTMRFLAVKSEETQEAAIAFRIRELLIRQRTQAINALRGHLAEFGQIVPQGAASLRY
jgi:transposase